MSQLGLIICPQSALTLAAMQSFKGVTGQECAKIDAFIGLLGPLKPRDAQ